MDKQQAEAIADALLLEKQVAQEEAVRRKALAEQRRQMQRRVGGWGLVGLGAGSIFGHFVFEAVFPTGMIGLGLGMVAGRLIHERKSA